MFESWVELASASLPFSANHNTLPHSPWRWLRNTNKFAVTSNFTWLLREMGSQFCFSPFIWLTQISVSLSFAMLNCIYKGKGRTLISPNDLARVTEESALAVFWVSPGSLHQNQPCQVQLLAAEILYKKPHREFTWTFHQVFRHVNPSQNIKESPVKAQWWNTGSKNMNHLLALPLTKQSSLKQQGKGTNSTSYRKCPTARTRNHKPLATELGYSTKF